MTAEQKLDLPDKSRQPQSHSEQIALVQYIHDLVVELEGLAQKHQLRSLSACLSLASLEAKRYLHKGE